MSYQFEQEESASVAIRRVVTEEMEAARQDLTSSEDLHEGVHEARKRFKKIRAVLRMARPRLGKELFRAENRWFRDAGRALSDVRDAQALVETIEELAGWVDGTAREEAASGAIESVQAALEARRDRVVDASDVTRHAKEIAQELADRLDRPADWPLDPTEDAAGLFGDLADDLEAGLKKTYRDGRDAMATVFEEAPAPTHPAGWSGDDHEVHEWRKRVKDLWYHARLLEGTWPDLAGTWEDALDDLSDQLGDHHDLAVLREVLAEEDLVDAETVSALTGLAVERQTELLGEARRLGERIYAEKPKGYGRRMVSYWTTWRREAGAGDT